MRVYISSSYEDLKEERRAAIEAVRHLGLDLCNMENYGAEDRRPIERCLEDVRASDIYLGLFGLRYGSECPGHGGKSFTHLEYEEAARIPGVKCLIFLKDEKGAAWNADWIERDRTRIDGLRDHLRSTHLVQTFANSDRLYGAIIGALARNVPAPESGRAPGPRVVPDLLPYLVDRAGQEFQVRNALREADRSPSRRPLVLIVHGDDAQCHEEFARRLGEDALGRILGADALSGPVLRKVVKLPRPFRGEEAFRDQLEFSLAAQVARRGLATLDEVVSAFDAHRGPILMQFDSDAESWAAGGSRLFRAFLDFWARWPDLPKDRWLIICLNLAYGNSPAGWLARRRDRRLQGLIRDSLGPPCRIEAHSGVQVVVLDELAPIERQDVLDWAASDPVVQFCGPHRLADRVRGLYERPEHRRSGRIAMKPLADSLREYLCEHASVA